MMSLPKPLAVLAWKEIREFEKEKIMPLISTAERVGREEGLAEGIAIGARQSLLAGIELGLDLKFAARGLMLLAEIRLIEDVDLLRQVLAAIKQAESPEALRRQWLQP